MRVLFSILTIIGLSSVWGQDLEPLLLPDVDDDSTFKEPNSPNQGLGDVFSGLDFDSLIPPSLPKNLKLKNTGTIEYEKATKTIRYGGSIDARGDNGLKLKSTGASYSDTSKTLELLNDVILDDPKGVRIFANRGRFDTVANKVYLNGNVRAYQGATIYRGESITYDLEKQQFLSNQPRASLYPFLIEATQIERDTQNNKELFIAENGSLTTDDKQNPSFWIKTERTTIYPEEKVVLQKPSIHVGGKKILTLPRFTQHFDDRLGYRLLPGVRSNLGPFIKNRYGLMLGTGGSDPEGEADKPWLLAQGHVDFYGSRGVGLGLNLIDTRLDHLPDINGLTLYYIYDLDPNSRRSGIDRRSLNEDRFRIALQDRRYLNDLFGLETYLDTNLNFLSDDFLLEDFYRELARFDTEPDNTIALVGRGEHSLFTGLVRLRLNDFYRSDTRLPEITFEQTRRPIFGEAIYYENNTSFANLKERGSDLIRESLLEQQASLAPGEDLDRVNELLAERSFYRLHTFHELSVQYNYGGWLNIVPRIGAGYTYYADIANGVASQGREIFSAGFDTSLTWSRSMPEIQSDRWGLDGLVHVFQPYLSFSHVEAGDLDPGFNAIDRFPPSTRPQQLEVGRFNAIDSLNDWSIIRAGMRNKLITRRDGGTHDWLSVNTFLDIFNEDPEFNRSLSNLYNDITWNPVPWAQYSLRSQFPISGSEDGFTDLGFSASFMPNDSARVQLTYRYLDSHPILRDTNIFNFYTYYRINDEWGVSARHDWRLEDGRLEVQQYSVHRDWGSWVGSMGLSQRRNRGENELGIIFSLTLKDIPSLTLPFALEAQ